MTDIETHLALERVLHSREFSRTRRLAAFLPYVVEYALSGSTRRLKGHTIAVEALGRGVDFDPAIDPIVRVEAARLRRALARYYAEEGLEDPVVIALPLGCYVPAFSNSPLPQAPALMPDDASLADMPEVLIASRRVQIPALLTELRVAKQSLRRYRALLPDGAACPPPVRLLPPAPSHNAARPAHGRQDQQAEGAPAARAG